MRKPFSRTGSVWDIKLSPDHPLHPDQTYAEKLKRQFAYTTTSSPIRGSYPKPFQTTSNRTSYSTAIYVVPANQPRIKVTKRNSNGSGTAVGSGDGTQMVINSVPVPTDDNGNVLAGMDAFGTDRSMVIWCKETGELWEFWKWMASDVANGFAGPTCGNAGYAQNIRRFSGIYPRFQGVRACGATILGGLVTMDDVEHGSIDHALAISVNVAESFYEAPANRNDNLAIGVGLASDAPPGTTVRDDAVPQGTMYRLPADTPAPTGGNAITQMLFRAARDYGIMVVDCSNGIAFYFQDEKTMNQANGKYHEPGSSTSPITTASAASLDAVPWQQLKRIQYLPPVPGGSQLVRTGGAPALLRGF